MQKLKVGVFLLTCAILMASGFTIVSKLYRSAGMHYKIEFTGSVLGLNEGSIVEYRGVPIGKVERISVTDNDLALAQIVVDPLKVTLKEGVEAKLVIYSLAAGTMAISLSGSRPDAPPLHSNSKIPSRVSTLDAVSSQMETLMQNLNEISDKVRSGITGLEKGKLADAVYHFDDLICKGQDVLDRGQVLVDESILTMTDVRGSVGTVTDRFAQLSADVGSLAQELNGLAKEVRDKLAQMDVAKTQEQLNRALENVADISQRINEGVKKLGDATDSTLHEADNVQHSLDTSLRDVSIALESVSALVNQLRSDPASLVRGKAKVQEDE